MDSHPLDRGELLQRRRDIDAWVRSRNLRAQDLWSEVLRPPCGNMDELMQRISSTPLLAEHLQAACAHIADKRRRSVSASGSVPDEPAGRWIIFDPSCADFSCLAQMEGLADKADAPGWDVWVATGDVGTDCPKLVCWIPDMLVEQMDYVTKLSLCEALRWDEQT